MSLSRSVVCERSGKLEGATYEAMRKRMSFGDFEYAHKDLQPKLLFYRFLAPLPELPNFPRHERLEIFIPSTIVCDGRSSPFWLYSKDGYVHRTDNFTHSQLFSHFASHDKNELVAISKTVYLVLIAIAEAHRRGVGTQRGHSEHKRTEGKAEDRGVQQGPHSNSEAHQVQGQKSLHLPHCLEQGKSALLLPRYQQGSCGHKRRPPMTIPQRRWRKDTRWI